MKLHLAYLLAFTVATESAALADTQYLRQRKATTTCVDNHDYNIVIVGAGVAGEC